MSAQKERLQSRDQRPFKIVDLNYVSLYIQDLSEAIEFYSRVLGTPENVEEGSEIYGWRMGATWLTLFPSKEHTHNDSNPRNCEFAIQGSHPDEVDSLHQALIDAGAKNCWTPEDIKMYERMRFSCVDDPFGVRIDVYYPLRTDG